MNSALEILRREREAAADEAKALRVRIKELDAAITMLEQGVLTKPAAKGDGDLSTLVLDVLTDAGSSGMLAKAVAGTLTEQGRKTSDASVSSTLSRLKSDGKVRNDRGLWFAVADSDEEEEEIDWASLPPGWEAGDTSADPRTGFADDLEDDIAF